MELIFFFEAEKVRIQDRRKKIVLLYHDILGKFVKNAGLEDNNNDVEGEELLNVKFNQKELQLSDSEMYLGPRVEAFLVKMGLNRKSSEITFWLLQAREFYEEAIFKMKKYFSTSIIRSETLKALEVLSPSSWALQDLDSLKKYWRLLAEKFSNVVEVKQVPALLSEVTLLKAVKVLVARPREVDKFFSALSRENDEDEKFSFPLLSKLGIALSTIYNSSSPAERNFSLMNLIVGDPRKNRTSQLLLLVKMLITAEMRALASSCSRCKALESKGEQSPHCHCSLWYPSEELLVSMRDGQPSRRYRAFLEENRKEEEILRELKQLEATDDATEEAKDMKSEVLKLKRREWRKSRWRRRSQKEKRNI